MKKIMSLILTICLVFGICSFLVGCNPETEEQTDATKTQLYVGVRESGVGQAWAIQLKKDFEAEYADWVNPNDSSKVGVQVIIDYKGEEFDSYKLRTSMNSVRQDVIFSNNIVLNDLIEHPETGTQMIDITDVITEGEDSIYDRMLAYNDRKSVLNYGTKEEPKFYALPWFEADFGMVYDVDMFEAYELFDLAGYKGLNCIDGDADDNLGADGRQGTYDDGMPATWEDMKILLDVMVQKGITPFTYAAKATDGTYQNRWLSSIWASYEGANDYSLLATMDGVADDGTAINVKNAYTLAKQQGKLAALKVAEYLVKHNTEEENGEVRSKYLYKGVYSTGTYSYINAQNDFINSWPSSKTTSFTKMKPIGFLLEGTWWENEARQEGIFDDCLRDYEDQENLDYGERNFAFFPFPKFKGSSDIPDQTNDKTTFGGQIGVQTGVAFINKNTKQAELAKEFLKFAYSDAMNASFTKITGVSRAMDYELSASDLKALTPFCRSLWEITHGGNSDVERVETLTRHKLYYYQKTEAIDTFGFASRVAGVGESANGDRLDKPLENFMSAMAQNYTLTAELYFNNPIAGSEALTEARWNQMLTAAQITVE